MSSFIFQKYTGKTDRDFAKWDHKVRIFMRARFGQEIFEAMCSAERHEKPLVQVLTVTSMVRMQMMLIKSQIWNAS